MIKAGLIGLGKMGLSHQSMLNAHPEIELKAVCDTSSYLLDVLSKYTGVTTYTDYKRMFEAEDLDCVFVATPSRYHEEIVAASLERNLHVFCEKPFALDPSTGYHLAEIAERKKLVNQVGYHYRFVATFNEAKRLLDARVLGDIHHVRVEAYGPVVLRAKGTTWRAQKSEGGGCLLDYACHAIDLVNYLIGRPTSVAGTVLNGVFSNDVDDEIYASFKFKSGFSGQLATNWSDESHRKMSVRICIWGTNGRMNVDRQEIQTYIRSSNQPLEGIKKGWNVRYTTDLTQPVWFYVRGEEYSAQIDHFVQCVKTGATAVSTFRTASDAALVAKKMREDSARPQLEVSLRDATTSEGQGTIQAPAAGRSFVRTLLGRLFSPSQL